MSSQHKQNKPNEKNPKFGALPLSTSGPQDCALVGSALLNTPYFNKGAAFPAEERETFKLTGLLPQHASSLDEQVKRAYQQYSSRHDDLAKNTFMTSLAEQNHVLYYRVSPPLFSYSESMATRLCFLQRNPRLCVLAEGRQWYFARDSNHVYLMLFALLRGRTSGVMCDKPISIPETLFVSDITFKILGFLQRAHPYTFPFAIHFLFSSSDKT
jgi:hypothetical protein